MFSITKLKRGLKEDMEKCETEKAEKKKIWDQYFMSMVVVLVSMKSRDPSTKIGAVIVGVDNEILSTGYNGFPIGVGYSEKRLQRPLKYKLVCHAERNAIDLAARNGIKLYNSKMYTHGIPCCECCKSIIQAGIQEIIVFSNYGFISDVWKEDFEISKMMLEESDVKVTYFSEDVYNNLTSLRNGVEWTND